MAFLWIIIFCTLPSFAALQSPNVTVINAAIILPQTNSSFLPFDYDKLTPAFNLAFAKAEQMYNVRFKRYLGLYPYSCQDSQALGQAVTALQQNPIQVFFGPACYDDLAAVSKLGSFYNITVVSGGGSYAESLSTYPYTTRIAYNMIDQWSLFLMMCAQYNWQNIAVVYDADRDSSTSGGIYQKNGDGLMRLLKSKNLKPTEIVNSFQRSANAPVDPSKLDKMLSEGSKSARVMVFLTDYLKLRSYMIQAKRRGMCNGDYAFFAADVLRNSILNTNRSWIMNDTYDTEAEAAFQCLFVVALRDTRKDVSYQIFRQELSKYNNAKQYGSTDISVDYYQGTFYDSVMMYAVAANETLEDGNDITAANIKLKLINKTFSGSHGVVRLGPSTDRVADYQILQLRSNETEFKPFAEVRAEYGQYTEIRPVLWLNRANQPPQNKPPCGFDGYDPECVAAARTTLAAGLGGALGFLLVFGVISALVYRKIKLKMELNDMNWVVLHSEITLQKTRKTKSIMSTATESVVSLTTSGKSAKSIFHPMLNFAKSTPTGLNNGANTMITESIMQTSVAMVTFRNTPAILRPCEHARIELTERIRSEVRIVKSMSNENVAKFLGACIEPTHTAVLMEYCSRGNLHDVLHNDTLNLEWIFRISFLTDIVQGLTYIHNTVLEHHGRLTSRCCFIDKRFLLKISDYGLPSFYNAGRQLGSADLLWTAPELLRAKDHVTPTQEADIFSIGIILQEIILRESPYFQTNMIPDDIVWHLIARENPPFRPLVDDPFCNPELITIMQTCWAENPLDRPRLGQLRASIKTLARLFGIERNSIIDTLLERMEQHTQNLENLVAEKTTELLDEKKKTDHLLYSILPKAVAEQLKRGQHVLPESFESVTLYFGDIVEFTTIASCSGPLDMVNFMNDLYSQFDEIIAAYDAYKVETIGDCYLIASGLPNRNGLNHAVEVARIAFQLREAITTFTIRHLPERRVQLRIGLNSGPCVAGVVGFATPRYCLFGDTVNVASRMESTGEPMKIQITQATEGILKKFQSFIVECRGDISVKGKGVMRTFWLIGENKALFHAVM
ncbi:atrial natriuretic peptide receptor 2-like [Paramacrobiotus metropolitanus]|uniref:atrial natriuretic peptide receptor 2-like n=1 Tax=Paramacrobiotus metropolitanus TaxID=2943436 RepID=UPI00244639EB|nr:atrial natriuretic peptide receptor 2-like [Paramacrobiotus metropolitanus]